MILFFGNPKLKVFAVEISEMGGLSVAFTLMLFFMDLHYQNSSIQQWTGLLIMAGSIVFGQLAYKQLNDGFISLGEGMKIGIGIVAL